jgi:acyl carrier protein
VTAQDQEVIEAIKSFVLKEFLLGEDPSALETSTPLITTGILDSIATLKLVVFLEERFGIELEAHEAGVEHLNTIADMVTLVASKRAGKA